MTFEAITKRHDRSTVTDPGKVYIPAAVREKANLNIGDNVKVLVDENSKSILVQKAN